MDELQLTRDNNSTGGIMTKKWPYFIIGLFISVLFGLIILFFEKSPDVASNFNLAYPVPDLISKNISSEDISAGENQHANAADSLFNAVALDSIRAWAQRIDTLNAKDRKPSFYQKYGHLFRWLGVFLPFLIFLLFEWYRYEQRKSLQNQFKIKVSNIKSALEIPELNFLKNEQFLSIIKKLKQPPRIGQVIDPKAEEVAADAAEKINSESPIDASYQLPAPAYIVLIDRLSNQDHYARLAETVVKSMKQAGLNIDYYFYEKDPRHCYKAEVYNWVYLNDLRVKYSDHRLILIGNGKGLIESHSNNFVDWIELLFSWKERAILSTREPASWGDAEQLLSREFILLPASMSGLAALSDHFDEPARLDMKIWKNGHSDSLKLDLNGEPDISQLKACLDEESLEWLCACAVYPELSWPLTLQLGEFTRLSEKELSEEKLLNLIRLEWFQTGKIPGAWRDVLVEHLDTGRLAFVRQKLIGMLEKGAISSGSGDQIQHHLDLATQKWLLESDNPSNRHQLRYAIQEAIKNELGIDAILYHRLEKQSGFCSLLPAFLKDWIFDQGIPILGIKKYIAASLAILTVLVGFLVIPVTQLPVNLTLRHNDSITGARLNQAEDQILTWSDDQTTVLWNIKTGMPAYQPMQHQSAVLGAQFYEDENYILTWTGDERNNIHLWKISNGQPAFPVLTVSKPVQYVQFSPADSVIMALLNDSSLHLWKMKGTQFVPQRFAGDSMRFSEIVLNKAKNQILGWTDQNELSVWNLKTGTPIFGPVKQKNKILGAQYFHNDSYLISWCADSTIRFWEIKTSQPVGVVMKHLGIIAGVIVSPDEKVLLSWTAATANLKSLIYLWDLKTGQLITEPREYNEEIQGAKIFKENSKIATWTRHGSVQLWSIENGIKPIKTFLIAGGVQGIHVGADERHLLAWNETGNVYCWDLEKSSQIYPKLQLHHPVNGACWSQQHKAVLAWSQGGIAKLVQVSSLLADSVTKISHYPEVVPLGNYDVNRNNSPSNSKSTQIHEENCPFVIGRYEITNSQFIQFLNESVALQRMNPDWLEADPILTKVKQLPSGQFIIVPGFENHPVIGVNWYGARAYCNWLTEKTKVPFRLPTETEWQYANAAGLANSSHLPAWQIEDNGWFEANAASGPRPIGEKNPNILGLYDLQGNLWEWCADTAFDNPSKSGETNRMICGGAWNSNLKDLEKTAWRKYVNAIPENNNSIGFRVVAAFTPDGIVEMHHQSQKVKNLTKIPESTEFDKVNEKIDVPTKADQLADAKLTRKTENEQIEIDFNKKNEKMPEKSVNLKSSSKLTELKTPVEQKKEETARQFTPKSNVKVGILEETEAAKQKSQSTGIDDILNRKSEITFDIKQQMPTDPANDKTKKLAGGRIGIKDAGNTPFGGKEQLPETAGSTSAPGRAGEKISLTNNGPNGQNNAATETTGRDFNSIFPVIKHHEASINYCYARGLKRNPNLKGKVVVRFTVTPKGNVSEVTVVSSTLNNEQVEQCIVSRMSRWNDFGEVDASKGDATFRHVYVFGY